MHCIVCGRSSRNVCAKGAVAATFCEAHAPDDAACVCVLRSG